jgi:hypothetical protein
MGYALRAVSSVVMLALMCAVLGALAALAVLAVLAVAVALVVAFIAGGGWATGAGVVVVGMLTAAAVALFLRRRHPRQHGAVGVSVSTEEQPLFWVEIYRVAEGMGVRPPDELLLFPDTNVEASGRRTWLGLRPGARRLHLGLPLLAGLTERELRAAMALAFCRSWAPISLARVIHGGQEIIGRIAGRVSEDSRVGRIVGRYSRAYVGVSLPIVRRRELAADTLCADFAGNGATAAALREIAVLSGGWAAFVEGYAEPARAVGFRPRDVFGSFTCFLDEPGRRERLAGCAGGPASEPPRAGDSQLSLADRLAAIALLPDDGLLDKSGPALSLMRNPEHVVSRVQESMFGESALEPATWEDIVPEAARAAAGEDAQQLARLAREGGLGPALSVAALLELMSFGLVDEMMRPVLAAGSPEVERQMAGRLVTGFLATAAIESGTASYQFSWAAPRQLVDDKGAVDDLALLVDTALADADTVSALELWLTAHSVSQELELGADLGQATQDGLPGSPEDSPSDSLSDSPSDSTEDGPGEDGSDRPRSLLVPESGTVSI